MKIFVYNLREFDEKPFFDQFCQAYGCDYAATGAAPTLENAHLAEGCNAINILTTKMDAALLELVAEAQRELLRRTSIAEETADTLIRLHSVPGPIFSAVTGQLLDTIGLRVDDAMYRAIANIAQYHNLISLLSG